MNILDTPRLAAYIKTKRGKRSLRAIQSEMPGVSASTLSRVENGALPDIRTFLAICDWLEVRAEEFIVNQAREEPLPTLQCIEVLLRSDSALSQESAEAMITVISSLYRAAAHGNAVLRDVQSKCLEVSVRVSDSEEREAETIPEATDL